MKTKFIRTIADSKGKLIKFLPEATDTWLSLAEAIRLADAGVIDAVVVRPKKGAPYLRARNDKTKANNFDAIAIRPKPKTNIGSEWHFATGIAPPHVRPDPKFEWNTKKRSLTDTAEALLGFVAIQKGVAKLSYLFLPYMSRFFTHWQDNTGTELEISMKRFLYISSNERDTVNDALIGAAEFAEANLEIGQARTIMTNSQGRNASNLVSEDTDMYSAVGGHTGFGKALIRKKDGFNFEMTFEWRLEDLFTFRNKINEMHEWHLKGLAQDFLVFGVWEKTFTWRIGKFDAKVNPRDP